MSNKASPNRYQGRFATPRNAKTRRLSPTGFLVELRGVEPLASRVRFAKSATRNVRITLPSRAKFLPGLRISGQRLKI